MKRRKLRESHSSASEGNKVSVNMDWENNAEDDDDWGNDNDSKHDEGDDWGDDDDWGDVGGATADDNTLIQAMQGKQVNYKLLDEISLVGLMNEEVKSVAQTLEFPHHAARALLQKHNWNNNKVVNYYLMNPTKAMSEAGVCLDQVVKPQTAGEMECSYCMDDVPATECDALECGHQICKPCWIDYLDSSTNTQTCVSLTCPHQCNAVVPPFKFKEYLKTSRYERYERFCAKSFVTHNKLMMWCPAPKCNIAAQFFNGGTDEVKCSCNFIFCAKCNSEGHNPSPCDVAEMWRIKASSESENIQWILARTKKCPKCGAHIEKNQGCNHMTCMHCKYEFCWLCKGDWKAHGSATGGYYKCNIYEKKKKGGSSSKISEEEKESENARTALEKYTFYLTRYDNHLKALNFAEQTLESTESRMDELTAKYKWKPNEATFLMDSVKCVIECRRLLAWTYPIGYYLPESVHLKSLFEDLQQNLEKFTEHLHELSEQGPEKLADNQVRAALKNHTRVTQKFRDNMMTGVHEEVNDFFSTKAWEEIKSRIGTG